MSKSPYTKERIVLQGDLKKRSPKGFLGLHMKQNRYFVLWEHQLCYYKKREDIVDESKCLGFILVENMSGVYKDRKPGQDSPDFNIVLEGVDRQFELSAETNEEATQWVDAIHDVLRKYGQAPIAITQTPNANVGGEKFWKPKIHQKLQLQRRQAIMAEVIDHPGDVTNRKYGKTLEEVAIITKALKSCAAFKIMDDILIKEACREMWEVVAAPHQLMISEGQNSGLYYVIVSGSFNSHKKNDIPEDDILPPPPPSSKNNPAPPASITASPRALTFSSTDFFTPASPINSESQLLVVGDSFGEQSLLYEAVSTCTVTAAETSKLFVIDRAHYKRLIAVASEKHFQQRVELLKSTAILSQLPDDVLKQIAEAFEERTFEAGDVIVRQDEPGDMFYFILEGEAVAIRNGEEIRRYNQPGDYFGEKSLMQQHKSRGATVTAITQLSVCYLSRLEFIALIGTVQESTKNGVRKYSVLSRELAIHDGVEFHDDDTPPPPPPDDEEVIHQDQTQTSTLPPPPEEDVVVVDIALPTIQDLTIEEKQVELPTSYVSEVNDLSQLRIIGTLGRGTFGHVQLVADKNEHTYALKAVNKAHVVRHNQVPHILNERAVMLELEHPFVVKLYRTMKDRNYLYFLLEPSLGGELFSVLRVADKFDNDTARFYAAIVIVVFQYLHSKDILYRDLKPENLLMDADGYLRVTDFGFAKKTRDRTYTFCGTPDYLAPEIVASAGHHTGADWWTLGVLIYEMLVGYTPFYDEAGPTQMYSKILAGKVYFPSGISPPAQDLIRSLLQTKPTRRLGVLLGGADVIKNHPWFRGFDWNALLQKTLPAPIPVTIKDKYDLSNFDAYDDVMEDHEYVVDPTNPNWDAIF